MLSCFLSPASFCLLVHPSEYRAAVDEGQRAAGGLPERSRARLSPSAAHRSCTVWPYSPLISWGLPVFFCFIIALLLLVSHRCRQRNTRPTGPLSQAASLLSFHCVLCYRLRLGHEQLPAAFKMDSSVFCYTITQKKDMFVQQVLADTCLVCV